MTFIVAEIGINWDGNYKLAEEMMTKAKQAGCDAVKFQAFTKELVQHHPESERLIQASVSRANIATIDELSKKIGIEWFCTPMYPEAVDFLDPFVSRFKIRELDGRQILENKMTPLVKKVIDTGKEVIISSVTPPVNISCLGSSDVKWLYCVPKYPCSLTDLNFEQIKKFTGYSNHCDNAIASITAVSLGAKILEIHITSDKKKNFIDNNVSFDYKELSDLVQQIRYIDKIKR